MAGRRSARNATRGGDEIPARRRIGARVAPAVVAALALAAVVLYPALEATRAAPLILAAAAAAVTLLVIGLAGMTSAVLPALVLAGAEYITWLVLDSRAIDAAAPLVAAGLALAAELAYRSLDARGPAPPAAGENGRRAVDALGVAVVGGVAGIVVLAVGDQTAGGGSVLEVVGVVAAVGAVALVAVLARSGLAVDSPRGPGSSR
jgi:hypothetical protein